MAELDADDAELESRSRTSGSSRGGRRLPQIDEDEVSTGDRDDSMDYISLSCNSLHEVSEIHSVIQKC